MEIELDMSLNLKSIRGNNWEETIVLGKVEAL